MTSLFTLMFLGTMSAADAKPHHHHTHRLTHKPAAVHVEHRPSRHARPSHAKVYRHEGHRYYRGPSFVWRWTSARWIGGHWARGHWEISYRI
jgi:hypothetical protein